MPKTFSDRWTGYKAHLAEYHRKYHMGEETLDQALRGCARETFRFLTQVIKKPTEQHQSAAHYTQVGVHAYNKKKYDSAEKHFRQAIAVDPNYARAYVYLGNTLYQIRAYDEAGRMWEKAIEADPRSEAADTAREKLDRLIKGQHGLVSNPQRPYRSKKEHQNGT